MIVCMTDAEKIESAIRAEIEKPTGELTEADYEEVEKLDLQESQISDLSALAELKELKRVDLFNNRISDASTLRELTKLKVLLLRENPDLTKDQIDQLKKALPDCTIVHDAIE